MNQRLKETLIRIASALVALPVYFFAIITDSFYCLPILFVSIVITVISLYEFYKITENSGAKPFVVLGITAAVLFNILMYLYGYGKVLGFSSFSGLNARFVLFFLVVFVSAVSIVQIFRRPIQGGIYSLGVTVLGGLLIVLPFSHIILIKFLRDGVFYILLLIVTVILNDVAAYFGGVFLGKHKIGFPVSPNKSWEGYCFALLFSMLSMIIFNQFCISFFGRELFSMVEAAIAGVLISIGASIGDLIESAVKRDGGIKDSGSIVPGHGGMWDVFDAMIFVMPLFYYYLIFKGVP